MYFSLRKAIIAVGRIAKEDAKHIMGYLAVISALSAWGENGSKMDEGKKTEEALAVKRVVGLL